MYIIFRDALPEIEISTTTGKWFVGFIKSRQERRIIKDFNTLGIKYYCPLSKVVIHAKEGYDTHYRSLFFSYISFCGNDLTKYEALSTNRLIRVLEVRDQEKFVKELSSVQANLKLDPMPLARKDLIVGKEYVILTGVFKDHVGKLARFGSTCMIEVENEMLRTIWHVEVVPKNLATVEIKC